VCEWESSHTHTHVTLASLVHEFIMKALLFFICLISDRYPGGRDKLDESIQGGELFQTIVYNQINIFMTHMSNYGSDRLALYTFESVIKFLRCWTNLKLSSAPPLQLGEQYFKLHPEESDPIWGNPCEYCLAACTTIGGNHMLSFPQARTHDTSRYGRATRAVIHCRNFS
jgi:hypothetical protein